MLLPSAWRLRSAAAACRRTPTSPAQPTAQEVHKLVDEPDIEYSIGNQCDDEETRGQAIVQGSICPYLVIWAIVWR